ncbi:MAG: coproporphyrinogen-III oxidase family protein [Candidatus Cryptobacteroides sp.]
MIYVHVPFCRSFCTYCGFYSEAVPLCGGKELPDNEKLYSGYAQAVVNEAASRRGMTIDSIRLHGSPDTLYIGGGTPSVLPFSVLSRIVSGIGRAVWDDPGHHYEEFTVEVNPEDVMEKGMDYLHGLKSLGVNRISMGVQSFDSGILKWMNRRHDAAGAERAFRMLRDAGFGNISIDLISGIAGLTDEMWSGTVDKALSLAPEHISAYQLSVDQGSALGDLAAEGRYTEAPEYVCRGQYDMLCGKLAAAGYVHYEISNFSLPGFEAVHNSAYWKRVPYTGLGAGAHSAMAREDAEHVHSSAAVNCRMWNADDIRKYILAWSSGDGSSSAGDAVMGQEYLTEEGIRTERLMLGLRTSAGVPVDWLPEGPYERLYVSGSLQKVDGPGGRPYVRIPEDRFFVSDDIVCSLLD